MINSSCKPSKGSFYFFLTSIIFLLALGFIFIYSSSSVYSFEKFGISYYYVKKQLIGFLLGLGCLLFIYILPPNLIKKFTPLAFFVSWGLTFLTLIPKWGNAIHGSSRWLTLCGISWQPSELLKLTTILYLAFLLSKNESHRMSFIRGYLPLLFILGCTSLVLLKQPDFGQTATLVTTAFILFFLAQCKTNHIIITFLPLLPVGIGLVYLKPYRFKRILTFLNPWNDPQGSGFQIIQSLIAIGSGSLKGLGIAQSKQKFFYLPMQHTDFIFSIIAEETGFIGSTFVIILYLVFLYTGFRLALELKDSFSHYSTIGFILLIGMQALINILVATGLMPTKGLGLPFISYGKSALIANLSMIGIILNCLKYAQEKEAINSSYCNKGYAPLL